jgi:hypothetical protein
MHCIKCGFWLGLEVIWATAMVWDKVLNKHCFENAVFSRLLPRCITLLGRGMSFFWGGNL